MILAIFQYIKYVYREIFTCPNGIFTCLGRGDIDFFYIWISLLQWTFIDKNAKESVESANILHVF